MRRYDIEQAARRTAWLADHAYQVRLTEHARTLAAAVGEVRPTQLRLDAASMPETYENLQLAEFDEVRLQFTFRVTDPSIERGNHTFG